MRSNAARWAICGLLLVLGGGISAAQEQREEEEREYLFRFRPARVTVAGSEPHGEAAAHGHGGLSESELAARQADTRRFWEDFKAGGGQLDQQVVIELFRRAGHFSVVHALLGNAISSDDSREIGRLRAGIHQEVLSRLTASGRFGDLLAVNDFGTVGNAKSDIDFTPFAADQAGADLVAAYNEEFARLTGGVTPGQMDIVAHKHEAFIPDWRQSQATSDFVQKLREGRRLLKANPEAYFLEGAYHQQVMGRSADGETLTWIERRPDGGVERRRANAAADPGFFYFKPDVRRRYAWGGAVGNWHFYHAHANDIVAQAKYLLRSLDDGARLAMLPDGETRRYKAFEKLSPGERRHVIEQIYGDRVDAATRASFLAVMETAVAIRDLKSQGMATDGPEAFKALIEVERARAPGLADEHLLAAAKKSMKRHGAALLLQNNVLAAGSRLGDWLAPNLKLGEFRTLSGEGELKRIRLDPEKVKRLQFSAFFELRDGLELLSQTEIERIKRDNPRYARDIVILQGIIHREREMALAGDGVDPLDAFRQRRTAADEVLAELGRLEAVAREGGTAHFLHELGGSTWRHGQQFEDWLQKTIVDALVFGPSLTDKRLLPYVEELRRATDDANQRGLGPKWMARLDKASSVVEVLKAYAREGELNQQVASVAAQELLSFLPGVGTVMQVTAGAEGVVTIASTQLIPGYGQVLLTLQLTKNTIELVGLTIFEPLRDERELLAYQGYLDPASGGLIASGQKLRVEGSVPSILAMVDPTGALPLDERRSRVYSYFHDDIVATLALDPSFPFTETEWPQEFLANEIGLLEQKLREHVLDWWHARGRFAGADEILAFRARLLGVDEEEFRAALERRLYRDYWKGRELALRRMIVEREGRYQELEERMAEVAAVELGLDQRRMSPELLGDFGQNGEMIFAHMLDGMPVLEPTMELLASPAVERLQRGGADETAEVKAVPEVSLRAQVHASTAQFREPWSIHWQLAPPDGPFEFAESGMRDGREQSVGGEAGPWPLRVTAIAFDADQREIARRTVALEVEKLALDAAYREEEPKDEVATDGAGGREPPVVAADDAAPPGARSSSDGARTAGAAGGADAEHTKAACERATRGAAQATEALDRLAGDAATLGRNSEELLAGARALANPLGQAGAGAERANALAGRVALLRDEAARLRAEICAAAEGAARAASAAERQQHLAEAQSGIARLRAVHSNAGSLVEEIRRAALAARAAADRVDALRAGLARLRSARADLERSLDRTRRQLDEAGENLDGAHSADGGTTAPAAGCVAQAQSQVDQAAARASSLRDGLAGQDARLKEIEALVPDDDVRATIIAAAADAEASLSIADAFLDTIANRLADAQSCAAAGDWTPAVREDAPTDAGWERGERESGLDRDIEAALARCEYGRAEALMAQLRQQESGHSWLERNRELVASLPDQARRRQELERTLAAFESAAAAGDTQLMSRTIEQAIGLADCPLDRGRLKPLASQVLALIDAETTAKEGEWQQAMRGAADRLRRQQELLSAILPQLERALRQIAAGNRPVAPGGSTGGGSTGGASGGDSRGGIAGAGTAGGGSPCAVYAPYGAAFGGREVREVYRFWVHEAPAPAGVVYTVVGTPAAQPPSGTRYGPFASFGDAEREARRLCPNPVAVEALAPGVARQPR